MTAAGMLWCLGVMLSVLGLAVMFGRRPYPGIAVGAGIEVVRWIAVGFASACWREIGFVLRATLLAPIIVAETVSLTSAYSEYPASCRQQVR